VALMTGARVDGWPEFSARTRLLVVAPHPDDETLATGVLLQQVLAAGGEVRILLLTAGGNNPWPQRVLERRWRIGAQDRCRWAARRATELQ
jgi:LmbE family N-acetylglucosaminyl deacetylase